VQVAALGADLTHLALGVNQHGDLDDLVAGVKQGHANAVLAASIFHFGTYSVGEAKRYMSSCGIDMRLD